MKRHVFKILVFCNAMLASLLGWLWFDQDGKLRNVHWRQPALVKPDVTLPADPRSERSGDVSQFMALLDRPLFSGTRRPPPPPPPPAPPPPPPPPPDPLDTTQLLGVFGSGATGGVLVRTDGHMRRVSIGEQIGQWVLKAVGSKDARFERGAESRSVGLSVSRLNTSSTTPLQVGQLGGAGTSMATGAASNSAGVPRPAVPAVPPPPVRATFGGSRPPPPPPPPPSVTEQ